MSEEIGTRAPTPTTRRRVQQRRIGHRHVADGAIENLVLGDKPTQQGAVAIGQIDVVGDDDEDHPPAEDARRVIEQPVEVRRQAGGIDGVVDRAQDALDVVARRGRRWRVAACALLERSAAPTGEEADEVAVAGGQLGDDAGGEHGDVALGARRVGERRHRATGVDDEHHGVLAGRHEALDERSPAAGRRLPVEVLDVVAEHVLAQVVEVHAPALVDRPVLAVEHAAHLAMRGSPDAATNVRLAA